MEISHNRRGFILIGAIAAVIIISILAFTLYTTMTSTYSLAKKNQDFQDAYYLARSGIEYALHIVEDSTLDPSDSTTWPNGNNFNLFDGNLDVEISDDVSGGYDITSTATTSGKTRTVRVNSSQTGEVLNWK